MKKITSILIGVCLILTGLGFASGQNENIQQQQKTVQFSKLSLFEMDDSVTVKLQGANSIMIQKDHYILPATIETFTFPIGTEIINVVCTPKKIHNEFISKELVIAPNPVILGQTSLSNHRNENQQARSINQWYEYKMGAGIYNDEHRLILTVQLYPVQYYPSESMLKWSEEIDIKVQYINPDKLMFTNDEYDLIVISPPEFSDELSSLISHKNRRGLSTKLVTLDEIYHGDYFPVNGRDEQEQIKYFIKDTVENWGVTNVLLVGGATMFPVRESSIFIEYDPPMTMEVYSDLYYADIYDADGGFSSWDSNGNNIFCEYNWGPENETDEVDLYPDVNIGRLACNSEEEVNICVNKIKTYEITKVYTENWFTDLVVIGGDTFPEYGGEIDEGEYYSDKIMMLMEGFQPDKLWASNGRLSGDTGVQNITNTLNKGAGFVVFSGHGYPHLWMTHPHKNSSIALPGPNGHYLNTDVSNLNNGEKLPIVILFACSNCDYNIPPCFGWSFLSNPNGGGIGSFGSTATAIAYAGNMVHRGLFGKITYDTLVAYRLEGARTLGDMWSYAVTKYIPKISFDMDMLTLVEFQLFGDPTLVVASESTPPDKPDTPTGPTSGRRNREYTFTTSTTDLDGDDIFYRFSWGEYIYSEWIGPFKSGETASTSYIWPQGGEYEVTVIAKDTNGVIGDRSDPLIVSMPKNREISHPLHQLLDNYPNLFPLLRMLFNL